MNDEIYEKMKSAQDAYHQIAMNIPGVHGTSIGIKEVKGKLTDTLAICIHLDKKKPIDEIPEEERIPKAIDGFPTDVLEHPMPEQIEDNAKYRPVEGGIQIQVNSKYGTIGCMVKDRTDGEICILSNQHVLNSKGDGVFQPKSDPVCDKIGNTKRVVLSARVDGGISTIKDYDTQYIAKIVSIGDVKGTHSVTLADLPYPVKKRGRTTSLTEGKITNINYNTRSTTGQSFTGQQFIRPDTINFADSGDSGSVIVDDNNNIVGLLWGVNKGNTPYTGVSSPIDDVLSELDIDIITASMVEELIPRIQYKDTMLGKLESLLCQSHRGRGYWQTFRDNEDVVRHVFHKTPRLYAIWKKIPREDLAAVIFEAISNSESSVPFKIGAMDTTNVCSILSDVMLRYFDDENIIKHVKLLNDDITNSIGKSWNSVFREK